MRVDRASRSLVAGMAVLLAVGWTGATASASPAWTVQAHPRPAAPRTGVFDAVACKSASNCTAVGDFDNATSARTLVEHWNGSAWSVQRSRNIGSAVENHLLGIDCPSASNCIAVGTADFTPLAQR